MPVRLVLTLNQEDAKTPFVFRATGARVFSLEEALFHCRAFWKQTADDVFSDAFAAWVHDQLSLPAFAGRLRDLRKAEPFAERVIGFLTMADYYTAEDVAPLRAELDRWERRAEWEKLKDRADELAFTQPERALALYREALEIEERPELYNNAGAAALALAMPGAAAEFFARGMKLSASPVMLLNMIEALIAAGNFEKAMEMIRFAKSAGDRSELRYFAGEIEYRKGDYLLSVPHYEQALSMDNRPEYALRLADALSKLRRYDKALAVLAGAPQTNAVRLKEAETHAAQGNLAAAVRKLETALAEDPNSAVLWKTMAAYCRQDYDPERADAAIRRALEIAPDDPAVNLEYARLRKVQGKTKDYQTLLRKVLSAMKRAYREAARP